MSSEVDQLQLALSKLQNPHDVRLTPKLEKDLLFWGVQVYRWTQEMQHKMTTQLKWLDSNTDHPSYEKRLAQWLTTLRQYEHGCDLLITVERML